MIETDFVYASGIPVLLALLIGLSFGNDLGALGFLLTVVIVLYTATFDSVVARYIPLKHYGDSD